MPHFSAGKSLRGSHKSFSAGPPRRRPLLSSRRLFSSVCVPFALHIASLTAQRILPSRASRRPREIYERTKIDCAEKNPQSPPLFFLLLLPSFGSGLLSGQTTSMNRKGGGRARREKFFHFGDLSLSLSPLRRAECRQSEIRAGNKGNKKSKEQDGQY